MREALRDAMAEEMRRDPDVFLMGEEVAQYQGAYKISQGLLEEFGAQARDRHADHRAGLCRRRRRRGHGRPEADRRVHDLELRHAGDRPDHQLGRQDALHVRRPDRLPDRVPRPQRRGRPRRRPAQPVLLGLVRARARPEGGGALQRRRRQGPAEGRHPRSQPRAGAGERDALRHAPARCPRARLDRADRQGAHRPARQPRDHRLVRARHGRTRWRRPRSWPRTASRPR